MNPKDKFSSDSQKNARLRGEYDKIAGEVDKCVFCDLRDKYIVKKLKGWVLTVNIFPYIDGQLLVLPERHIENYSELNEADLITSNKLVKKGIELIQEKLKIENYWIILRQGPLAGKTVKHLHWNIMPYVEGINTWHYQEIKTQPLNLAKILRKKNVRT